MRAIVVFFTSAAYLGYAPVAPGTFGTLAGIPLFLCFAELLPLFGPAVYVGTYALFVALACWLAGLAETMHDEHDSGKIVIDEVAGYLATTMFIEPSLAAVIVAFFVFRLLDIVKPFPANRIDASLSGGPGVVLDDVVSGLYANVVTRLVLAGLSWIGMGV